MMEMEKDQTMHPRNPKWWTEWKQGYEGHGITQKEEKLAPVNGL